MRRQLLAVLGLSLMVTTHAAAAGRSILLVARDLEGQPLPGLRFTYAGIESARTNTAGNVELAVPADHETGRQIKILLLPSPKRGDDWFLVNPQVNIPSPSNPAEVVLMKRSAFRKMAAEARDAPVTSAKGKDEPTAEERPRALVDAAARRGLTEKQLGTAITSFGETQDPKDQGIAAFLEGHYPRAEALLKGAAEKKEADLAETLRYLGASQYEQGKYEDAASSFRKAIALRGDDPVLLNWLGTTLYAQAKWPDHPEVATQLNNLALLLPATNRLGEAEPLMRRGLLILLEFQHRTGYEHPNLQGGLDNYRELLHTMGRSDAKVEAAIQSLRSSPK